MLRQGNPNFYENRLTRQVNRWEDKGEKERKRNPLRTPRTLHKTVTPSLRARPRPETGTWRENSNRYVTQLGRGNDCRSRGVPNISRPGGYNEGETGSVSGKSRRPKGHRKQSRFLLRSPTGHGGPTTPGDTPTTGQVNGPVVWVVTTP